MTDEKHFVDDSQQAKTTPIKGAAPHRHNFYQTIKDFYAFANPSLFIEVNNQLLNNYLEQERENENCSPKQIQDIVFIVGLQNQFITALKENWELHTKFTNSNTPDA